MQLSDLNPTKRFSDRVGNYKKYRPSYPEELLNFLNSRIALRGAGVADIGSGTGILTKLLLERGARVEAVEPNTEMREAAEKQLQGFASFHSQVGTAEATGLPATSIDLITCAQEFHWFDPLKARKEFDRILKARGLVALIWNDLIRDTPLGSAYEQLKLEFGGQRFQNVSTITQDVDSTLVHFFGKMGYESKYFQNFQELDRDGFVGRFFSSSYAPATKDSQYFSAQSALNTLFERFQSHGMIRLEYKTELFLGH